MGDAEFRKRAEALEQRLRVAITLEQPIELRGSGGVWPWWRRLRDGSGREDGAAHGQRLSSF